MSDFDEWWAKVDWTNGTFDTAKATWNHQQQIIDRKNERILMLQQRVEALEGQCDDSDRELVEALKRVEALEVVLRGMIELDSAITETDNLEKEMQLEELQKSLYITAASLLQEGE